MSLLFDNFNRANSDTLGTSSDGSFTWTEVAGDCDIASLQFRSGAAGTNTARAGSTSSANHFAQVEVPALSAVAGSAIGVCTRFDASADTCYVFYVRTDASQYRLFKRVAGVLTQIGSTVSEALPSGQFTIRLESNGTTHTCYVNGVSKISQTDSSITGNTAVGLLVAQITTNPNGIDHFIGGDLNTVIDFSTPKPITPDGLWTWFTSPRAVYDSGDDATYIGSVASDGLVYITQYNHATGLLQHKNLRNAVLEIDDHSNVAVWVRPDGKIQCFYSTHNDTSNRFRTSVNAGDITTFDSGGTIPKEAGDLNVSYQNPIYLSDNSTLYLFHRSRAGTAGAWGFNTSTDFTTFSALTKIWDNGTGKTPYCEICSNGVDRIDICVTDMHPVEGQSSVYHFYMLLSGGTITYHKTDGTLITAGTPHGTSDATLVYDGSSVRAWIWQIAYDTTTGYPSIVGTRYPSNDGSDIRYMLWKWNGSAWVETEITTAGTGLYSPEIYYAGGICFDGNNTNRLWLSKEVSGYYEMQVWDYAGGSWSKTADITTGSSGTDFVNGRPFSPQGYGTTSNDIACLYWSGRYTTYIDYNTQINAVWAASGLAAITPAAGLATASTIVGTSTAAATLTAAAGAATASTITASAIAAASMTAATGAATTSTLTGSAATAAAMTAAAGVATTSTLPASSSAVAAITAAAGAATASTLTASASAVATITAATGTATASTMTGAAVAVAGITQADGVATTSTLTGSGLTPGLAGMSPASGVATTSTMAGNSTASATLTTAAGATTGETLAGTSTAAAAMTPATGAATGETMTSGSSTIVSASMTAAAGSASASTFAASAVAASVCIAAAGAAAEQTMAASAMARAAMTAAAGVATGRTLVDANAVDTNSAWWTYTVAADNLTFAIPADDLTYAVGADQLAYEIGV